MIAIIPAAGKGTRMKTITGGGAKEMLPIAGRPVIAQTFDEAVAAQVDEVVLVSSPLKEDLNAYFLAQRFPKRLVIQPEPTGLAPAVILAGIKNDAIVLLPDAFYHPMQPSKRIGRMLTEGYDIVLFTEEVDESQVKKFGILEPVGSTVRILEKPAPTETASRRAIGGRYGFSSLALQKIAISIFEDPVADMPLTPAINDALRQQVQYTELKAELHERRFDCGSVNGYKRALREIE